MFAPFVDTMFITFAATILNDRHRDALLFIEALGSAIKSGHRPTSVRIPKVISAGRFGRRGAGTTNDTIAPATRALARGRESQLHHADRILREEPASPAVPYEAKESPTEYPLA